MVDDDADIEVLICKISRNACNDMLNVDVCVMRNKVSMCLLNLDQMTMIVSNNIQERR